MRQLLRLAGYRIRATFSGRWGGYLSLMLPIGLVGGLPMVRWQACDGPRVTERHHAS
jgi:hypothetical protein